MYLSVVYFATLYPSFLVFFFFDSKYLFFAHVCEYTNISSVILVTSRRLVYSVVTSCERIDYFMSSRNLSLNL